MEMLQWDNNKITISFIQVVRAMKINIMIETPQGSAGRRIYSGLKLTKSFTDALRNTMDHSFASLICQVGVHSSFWRHQPLCGTTCQTDYSRQTGLPGLRASSVERSTRRHRLFTIAHGFPASFKGLFDQEVLSWHRHLTATLTLPVVLVVVINYLPDTTFKIMMIDWLTNTFNEIVYRPTLGYSYRPTVC